MKFGYIGMGIMGSAMAKNLLSAGHQVAIWNRTPDTANCQELLEAGATMAESAAAAVAQSDVCFACLSDPAAALAVVFGAGGVLEGVAGKDYVDMSTVDEATSQRIAEAVAAKGGRFLEAPVSGSKKPAIDGTLIILAAGDRALYDKALPALDIMGKKSLFLGDVGSGARMKLVVNMIMGSMVTAFSEGLSLAGKAGLSQEQVLEVLDLGAMANGLFKLKGPQMMRRSFPPAFPLKHQQKDMRLALALGDDLAQPLPVAAAANETFKKAREMGFDDADMAAVYNAVASPPP